MFVQPVDICGNSTHYVRRYPSNKGYRKDLGIEFKSSMEANYYRFLQQICKGIQYSYEQEIFYFPSKNNVYNRTHFKKTDPTNYLNITAYVPDFKIRNGKRVWYVETKGYMDRESLEKARLFKKYYPWLNLYFVTNREYGKIKKGYSHLIRGWE